MANLQATRFFDVCDYKDMHEASYNPELRVTIGTVKSLHIAEAQWIHEHNQYILTSTAVYEICKNDNGYFGKRLYHNPQAQHCVRGRFHVGDADFIKSITGFNIVPVTTRYYGTFGQLTKRAEREYARGNKVHCGVEEGTLLFYCDVTTINH